MKRATSTSSVVMRTVIRPPLAALPSLPPGRSIGVGLERELLQGEELTGQPPFRIARRGLGYVDQGRRIFPDLTVDDNLEVARTGRMGRWSKADAHRFFPELTPLQHRLGHHLSGSEQRMLSIGRALMGNPLLLLCDEPSEGL